MVVAFSLAEEDVGGFRGTNGVLYGLVQCTAIPVNTVLPAEKEARHVPRIAPQTIHVLGLYLESDLDVQGSRIS